MNDSFPRIELENTILVFDPENNLFYTCKKDEEKYRQRTPTKSAKGYRAIRVGKKCFYVHRLVYKLYNNDWDIYDSKCLIDHIDQVRHNNVITNLRKATPSQNGFNRNCKGYCFHKASGKYHARIFVNRELAWSGYFNTAEEAREEYLKKKLIYHKF